MHADELTPENIYWPGIPGTVLTSCDHASADLHQMRRLGGKWAFCSRHPTRNEQVDGSSTSSLEKTGAPQLAQNV
jgi:hypothetical protein